MENIVSSIEITIECQEADYKGNYRISSLLSKLSDLATYNAIEVGIWNINMANHYGFILAKETLVLKRPIKVGEKIKISTRAAQCKRIQFIRNYWIEDSDGNEIGAIYSLWTLLDLEKRKLTKPDKAGIIMPTIIPYEYSLNEYHEILKDLELTYVMDRTVLYSDVDVNLHLNNSRYIEWAFDSLPLSLFENYYLSDVSVAYKKELVPNATCKIYHYIDNEYVKVVFMSMDEQTIHFELGAKVNSL